MACNKLPERGFQKIDNSMSDRDKLVQFIIPDHQYTYWEYGFSGMRGNKIIRFVGDSSLKSKYKIAIPDRGFFIDCLPSFCYSYIAYIDSNKVKFVTEEKDLCNFIGKIDNLEEALLVSETEGLWFDEMDLRGGSYKKT